MDSTYQQLKQLVLDYLPLAKDAIHIYIGFACLVLSVILLRIPLSSLKSLILGFAVSLGMEAMDLRDNRDYPQVVRWLGSLRDVVNTNLIPLVVVLLSKTRRNGKG